MKDMITVYCDSLQGFYDCAPGTTVGELARKIDTGCRYPVVAALVDNMLKELTFPIYTSHTVKFIDCTHPDGRRTYSRSLSFVLQKAAVDLFPDLSLFLDYTPASCAAIPETGSMSPSRQVRTGWEPSASGWRR